MRILEFFKLMRPEGWTKNLVVLAGIIFSRHLGAVNSLVLALKALAAFCLVSSSVYVINDIVDREADSRHPVKRNRPIASGRISVSEGLVLAAVLLAASLWLAWGLGMPFIATVVSYFILVVIYSFALKRMVILDVLAIAMGFVLRAAGGALAVRVDISPWLLACTLLLALFLALAKRRAELFALGVDSPRHRTILAEYPGQFLDVLLSVVTCSVIMCYILYTFSDRTITFYGNDRLKFTVPVVIYGIFRYLYLVMVREKGGRPERLLFIDLPLLGSVLVWCTIVGLVVYLP